MKKLVILGSAKNSRNLAPFNDKSFEIWSVCSNVEWMEREEGRADLWFELHGRDLETKVLEKLKRIREPIFLQEKHPDLQNSKRFPIESIISDFGKWFDSSPAYMLAYGLQQGFQEIHVYGLNMSSDTEYAYQRENFTYLLGQAVGRGVKVVVPEDSSLLKANYLYGYEKPPLFMQLIEDKLEMAGKEIQEVMAVKHDAELKFIKLQGVCEALNFMFNHMRGK